MRTLAYVEGLRRERVGALAELARFEAMRPELREWMAGDDGRLPEPPSVAERVVRARERLEDIDREIARASG